LHVPAGRATERAKAWPQGSGRLRGARPDAGGTHFDALRGA
jgi:hypothetical protein